MDTSDLQRALNQTAAAFSAAFPSLRHKFHAAGVAAPVGRDLDLSGVCEPMTKQDVFETARGDLLALLKAHAGELAGIVSSSGSGSGPVGFSVARPAERAAVGAFIDTALETDFGIDLSQRTLLINCLPMGIHVASEKACVAEVSVREDLALNIAAFFDPVFDNIVFLFDPLFGNKLVAHKHRQGIALSAAVFAVIGEERFGDRYRAYITRELCGADDPFARVFSSMGFGEVGLHVFHETPAILEIRRRLNDDPGRAAALFEADSRCLPLIFTYDPGRFFFEFTPTKLAGAGALALTTLGDTLVPLLRYRTGDVGGFLDKARLTEALGPLDAVPEAPLVSVYGRERDLAADKLLTWELKDRLYRTTESARAVSGAVRFEPGDKVLHVQLSADVADRAAAEAQVRSALDTGEVAVRCWDHADFPYGWSIDYERKFAYRAP
jgi:phenylacetate-CoA ligase